MAQGEAGLGESEAASPGAQGTAGLEPGGKVARAGRLAGAGTCGAAVRGRGLREEPGAPQGGRRAKHTGRTGAALTGHVSPHTPEGALGLAPAAALRGLCPCSWEHPRGALPAPQGLCASRGARVWGCTGACRRAERRGGSQGDGGRLPRPARPPRTLSADACLGGFCPCVCRQPRPGRQVARGSSASETTE